MIPVRGSFSAMFEMTIKGGPKVGEKYWRTERVEAWSDDGDALILDGDSGKLVVASNRKNFDGVVSSDESPIIAAFPGGGWYVKFRDDPLEYCPVIAWVVDEDGHTRPIINDGNGSPARPDEYRDDVEYTIVPPESLQ